MANQLVFCNEHLEGFKSLDDNLKLYGKDYKLLKKGVWYLLQGHA